MKTPLLVMAAALLSLSLVSLCPAAPAAEEAALAPAAAAEAVKATDNGSPGSGEPDGEEGPVIADPFGPTNRLMFELNDSLYFRLFEPVTRAYARIPEDIRIVVSNIYDNLNAPGRALNNLMQLRLKGAGNELLRFLLNSFVGVGGMGDAARDAFGIKKQEADFGQTLGRYGIDHGFYLVWPVLGPSSLRDSVGLVGDRFMYPLTYVSSSDLTFWQAAGLYAHEKVNDTSFKPGDYESFKEAAIDPYVSMRDAFVQNRKKKVDESKQ